MKIVLIPCIDIVYGWICKFFWLWIMKFINESVIGMEQVESLIV